MRLSTTFFALATLLGSVSAAPIKRQTVDPINAVVFSQSQHFFCLRFKVPTYCLSITDFAHTLELLETEFYRQALAKFNDVDFTNAGFVSAQIPAQLFQVIESDEAAHAAFLEVRSCLRCVLFCLITAQ